MGHAQYRLRVAVDPVPGGGFKYVLQVEHEPPDPARNAIAPAGPVRVAVDFDSRPYLLGTVLDYRDNPESAGFAFDNPNLKPAPDDRPTAGKHLAPVTAGAARPTPPPSHCPRLTARKWAG